MLSLVEKMSTLSNKFTQLAQKMVAKFGVVSQWELVQKTSVSSEDDPTAYEESVETVTLVDVAVASWKESDYDGKTIQIGDKIGFIPAKLTYPVPSVGDVLVSPADNTRYRIVAPLSVLAVNDVTCAYKVNLRG